MFLKRLSLTNVRSISHLDLNFDGEDQATRKWTLLLGENGTGKSTVLRAISLLLCGSEALSELLLKPDNWIRLGEKECHIEADLVTADDQERHLSLHIRQGDGIRDVFARNSEHLDDIDSALQHSLSNYLTIGYGASRRLASNRSASLQSGDVFNHRRAGNVATLFSTDAVLNPLDTWAMDLDYRMSSAGVDTVKAALSDLLPDVSLSRIDRDNRELLFNTEDGEVPLGQLSDGYQNMAAWCGDLLYRITEAKGNHKNPLTARGLLLIDEVDLHLHPVWQRMLKQFLDTKLPNFQIIATTHSPLTAQQAGPGELFFLRRPGDHEPAALEQFHGAARDLMVHQVLLSPAFGLPTIDSQYVENSRTEYKRLDAKSKLTSGEKKRHAELREQLTDLPDWGTESEHDRAQIALLDQIRDALQADKPNKNGRK